MISRDDTPDPDDWDQDDTDDLTDVEMDDEELFFDDIDDEDDKELDFESDDRYKSFSARRRIEIANEDKWLKSAMADFDDFEQIEGFGDGYVEEFSY